MRRGPLLPANFTHDDLIAAGLTEGDCDEVLAFREFLHVAGPVPSKDERDAGATVAVPEPWYSYALGTLTGRQALEAAAHAEDDGPACVSCGCTENRACEGGCSWVSLNPPICSACL
ncbi:MAG TPA: hypothetical protein VH063_15840 [Gaiellaceae bacterium]|jgi:hypothetical protein|nr:hypothetical protein [Gaiellaceae bacterium]